MANDTIRKYWIKQSWIFNLEAMHDKLSVMFIDAEEGNLDLPVEIAGIVCEEPLDILSVRDRADTFEWKAKRGKVTSWEYGEIKKLVEWRVESRYVTCLSNGMKESEAGKCFEDL